MKLYLFNFLLVCFIKSILTFPQNKLPSNAIIVAKDGSGKYNTVNILLLLLLLLLYFSKF